jgi:hypothetical protein
MEDITFNNNYLIQNDFIAQGVKHCAMICN